MKDHSVKIETHLVISREGEVLEVKHCDHDDWQAIEAARGALVVDAPDLAAAYARLGEPGLAAEIARRRAAHDAETARTNGTA